METTLTPARVEQLKRAAKRLARDENIPLSEAQQRLAVANGYRNWSLLQKRSRAGAALTAPPAHPSKTVLPAAVPTPSAATPRDRYYLHGDQHAEDSTKFYCSSCDLFVDASHFFAQHDRQKTLERAHAALKSWSTRPPAIAIRRPAGSPNMLEALANAQAAAHEASRGPFHRWLERHKGKNTITGDLAGDVMADKDFPVAVATLQDAEDYLHSLSASDAAVKALKGAWRQFKTHEKKASGSV